MADVAPLGFSRAEIRQELAPLRRPFRVAVDRAKNPFNIGSIIRTAHSFLAQEVMLIGSEPWYERAAMGMQRYENVGEYASTQDFLNKAAEQSQRIVVFEKEYATTDLWNAKLGENIIMLFGNEDDGVCAELRAAAHEIVAIPMYGINHSYPVSVAAGIAMAEWARRYALSRD